MIDGVCVQLRDATESSVRVTLAASGDVDLRGEWELYGPRCEYARTLASTFRGRATEAGGLEFLVTEPCYWSPTMPFLYELRRIDSLADGETHCFGLRQLIAHGRNLRLDGERIVLRGAWSQTLDTAAASRAHDLECAVTLSAADEFEFSAASRLGAFVLLDATRFEGDLGTLLERVSWQPGVAAVTLSRERLESARELPVKAAGVLLAQQFDSLDWGDANSLASGVAVVVAMLNESERPPAWMAACGRPVVAIRRGAAYADFEQARIGCDRLQAELAPEFDLAGYFVSATLES
jgi:hypothetical protein